MRGLKDCLQLGGMALLWLSAQAHAQIQTPVLPQRIVSLNLCTDQILLQLVAPQRIAALSWLSASPESSALHAQARPLRHVRGHAEEVLALRPDLVLVGTATTRFTARLLREFGVPVLALPGVKNFAEVREQIRQVAHAVGAVAEGEALLARFDARHAVMQAQAAARPAAVAMQYLAGGRSAGAGTLYDDIFAAGGHANGAARAGLRGYGAMPIERVLVEQPDVLVTSDYRRHVATQGNRLLSHPALAHLSLHELVLPSRLSVCGGPWNLEAAALLAARGERS
ncbi:ABC transporter substrate-binding protein [Paucibacter sp. KBW04]|uniref:ABC transporter substrate-binding protein n=1 Tax=Paucibacter sp. KBW04 TaxID=2153361 RepID=UPI000F582767|nr:ABC transporter substrate-binding protein [Paucibacter sp. KBW04]RQO54433.1 ABC transporter substrate-binding protein [Paucibacter sp. KBW04]